MEQKEFKYKMMLQFDQQFNDMVRQQSNDLIKYLAVLGAVFVAYGYLLTHDIPKDQNSIIKPDKDLLIIGIHVLANLVILFLIFMNFSYAYSFRRQQAIVQEIRKASNLDEGQINLLNIINFKCNPEGLNCGNWIIQHYATIFWFLIAFALALCVFGCCCVENLSWVSIICGVVMLVAIMVGYQCNYCRLKEDDQPCKDCCKSCKKVESD